MRLSAAQSGNRIGAEYTIDLDSVSTNGWHLKCGGCGTVIRDITTVMASSTLDPNRPPARLPYAIFLGSRVAPVLTTPTRQDKTQ